VCFCACIVLPLLLTHKHICACLLDIASCALLPTRRQDWEYKGQFKLGGFWLYESKDVVTDSLVFFVVGRLYNQRGVDHLAWLLTAFLANVYASSINDFAFLRHSFTLYELHCTWPWKLWVFVIVLTGVTSSLLFLHIRYYVRHQILLRKLFELTMCVVLFFLPYTFSPYLHLHHWFAGWFIGMQANLDVAWSRAAMAWCWGLYINGIAAYGRDPVLTCGYTYWLSMQNVCPYLKCYWDALKAAHHNETSTPTYAPMVPPDWKNCSASTYHARY
jgi:hypothetical protein